MPKNIFFLLASVILLNYSYSAQANETKSQIIIQHWQTQNSVPVYFVAVNELPVIDIKLVFTAGSARDDERFGLAYLANKMFMPKLSPTPQGGFKDIGAHYSTGINRDMAVLSLRSLSTEQVLKPALQAFLATISAPSLTEGNLQKNKKVLFTKIQKEIDSVKGEGNVALLKLIYNQHPYAHSPLGTKTSVEKISLEDIKDFHSHFYNNANMIITMVGDLKQEQAKTIAEQISKVFPTGQRAVELPLATPTLTNTEPKKVPHISSQTYLALGEVSIAPNNPDFFPLLVGNEILGGGALLSRLGKEIRVKHGLAYRLASRLQNWQARGPFIISVYTYHSHVQLALHLTQQVLNKFIAEGPTHEELNAAKQKLIGYFHARHDSNQAIIKTLVNIGFYNLPLDYFNTYQDKINAVTVKQVKEAMQKHIHPQQLEVTITGGDKH